MSFLGLFKQRTKAKTPDEVPRKAASSPVLELSLPPPSLDIASEPNLREKEKEPQTPTSPREDDTGNWSKVEASESESITEKQNRDGRLRVSKAILSIEQARVLVQVCGEAIIQRGVTTLGLFRPFRHGESQQEVTKLALLFLDYADPSSANASGLFVPKSAEGRLQNFTDELQYTDTHNVAAVLKWGLRHLQTHADSTDLLSCLYPLLASICAHSEWNGLSTRRICRVLAVYVFPLPGPLPAHGSTNAGELKVWEKIYNHYRSSGDKLEVMLKDWLRTQTDLPARLREVRDSPPSHGRLINVLNIDISTPSSVLERSTSINDQVTGLATPHSQDIKAGNVLHLLMRALKAAGEQKEWSHVVSVAADHPVDKLIGLEGRRILRVLGIDQVLIYRVGKDIPEQNPILDFGAFSPETRRAASGGHTRSSSLQRNLISVPESPVDQNWSSFTTSGFSAAPLDITTGLGDYDTTKFSTLSPSIYKSSLYQPSKSKEIPAPEEDERSKILHVGTTTLEEEFADVWLDTLASRVGPWATFFLLELETPVVRALQSASVSADYLLVSELFHTPKIEAPTPLPTPDTSVKRAPSLIKKSGETRKWNKRVSAIFGTAKTSDFQPDKEKSRKRSSILGDSLFAQVKNAESFSRNSIGSPSANALSTTTSKTSSILPTAPLSSTFSMKKTESKPFFNTIPTPVAEVAPEKTPEVDVVPAPAAEKKEENVPSEQQPTDTLPEKVFQEETLESEQVIVDTEPVPIPAEVDSPKEDFIPVVEDQVVASVEVEVEKDEHEEAAIAVEQKSLEDTLPTPPPKEEETEVVSAVEQTKDTEAQSEEPEVVREHTVQPETSSEALPEPANENKVEDSEKSIVEETETPEKLEVEQTPVEEVPIAEEVFAVEEPVAEETAKPIEERESSEVVAPLVTDVKQDQELSKESPVPQSRRNSAFLPSTESISDSRRNSALLPSPDSVTSKISLPGSLRSGRVSTEPAAQNLAEKFFDKERTELQLREVSKQEKEKDVAVKPRPQPVSSVRKRVLELEAAAAAGVDRAPSPTPSKLVGLRAQFADKDGALKGGSPSSFRGKRQSLESSIGSAYTPRKISNPIPGLSEFGVRSPSPIPIQTSTGPSSQLQINESPIDPLLKTVVRPVTPPSLTTEPSEESQPSSPEKKHQIEDSDITVVAEPVEDSFPKDMEKAVDAPVALADMLETTRA